MLHVTDHMFSGSRAEPSRVREVHLVRALCAFRQSERRWHPFAGGAPPLPLSRLSEKCRAMARARINARFCWLYDPFGCPFGLRMTDLDLDRANSLIHDRGVMRG